MISTVEELARVEGVAVGERNRGATCDHTVGHDPETLEPRGQRCGATGAGILFWKDGRYSVACRAHGPESLVVPARALIFAWVKW